MWRRFYRFAKGAKKITPGVNGVLIGFGFFGNLWFSENRILLVFLCGYWIDDVKVRRLLP